MHMYISIDTLELIKNWGAQVGDPWVFALMDPRTAIPGAGVTQLYYPPTMVVDYHTNDLWLLRKIKPCLSSILKKASRWAIHLLVRIFK